MLPFTVPPRVQRKGPSLLVGYFGDSTTRGAWANGKDFPDNYSYKTLAPLIRSSLAQDFSPIEVNQLGNDGESAASLVYGGWIPNAKVVADPFTTRLSAAPYDAVVVGVGICDALYGRSVETFQFLMDEVFAAAKTADIPIFFETPNPIPGSQYSATLESYRPCFRGYDLIIDQNYKMEMSDAFHPTPASYDIKVKNIADALRRAMIRRTMMIYV